MKRRRYLSYLPIALLSVATLVGCADKDGSVFGFGGKNSVNITFNAGNEGVWDNGTCLKTITILKGYTWSFVSQYASQGIIQGTDIDTEREFDYWTLNGAEIDPNYTINKDVVFDAYYVPVEFTITLKAVKDGEEQHHVFNESDPTREVTAIPSGSTWKDVKNNPAFGDVIPHPVSEPSGIEFNYYTNQTGMRIEDSYVIKNNDIFTGNYSYSIPRDFCTDDWSIIGEAADRGFEYISTHEHEDWGYKDEYEADHYTYQGPDDPGPIQYEKEPNTFVGLQHIVTIGQRKYNVKVIGEDCDRISSTKFATLTFEFTDIVSTNHSFDSINQNTNNFQNSGLKDYLNNKFFYMLPKDLQDVIRPVNKMTNWGNYNSSGNNKLSREMVWPLSLREMGFTKTSDELTVENEGVKAAYGESYSAYNETTYGEDDLAAKRVRCLRKADGTRGAAASYWLRSPDVNSAHFTWTINETGRLNPTPTDIATANGIVCGFSVGALEVSDKAVTFNVKANGGTWNGTDDEDFVYNDVQEGDMFRNAYNYMKIVHHADPVKAPELERVWNFQGWYRSNGTLIQANDLISTSITVYAQYTDTDIHQITCTNDKYSITESSFLSGNPFKVSIKPNIYYDSEGEQYYIHKYPQSDGLVLTNNNGIKLREGTDYTYSSANGEITINASAAVSDIKVNILFAPIACTWSQINDIATTDENNQRDLSATPGEYAKQFFDPGDSTSLYINGINHKVHIIDMGHAGDTFTSEGKTLTGAINFDFMTVASQMDGVPSPIESKFYDDEQSGGDDGDIHAMKYVDASLYKANQSFYLNTPSDFRSYIKNVKKITIEGGTGTASNKTFNAYFYPLSIAEMNYKFDGNDSDIITDPNVPSYYEDLDEGTPYALYKNCNTGDILENNVYLDKYEPDGQIVSNYYSRTGSWYATRGLIFTYNHYVNGWVSRQSAIYPVIGTYSGMSFANHEAPFPNPPTRTSRPFAPGFTI